MKQDVSKTLEIAHLELLRRAYTHNDLEAWAEFQQSLEKTVRTWFRKHPGYEVVCSIQSDNHCIALAFERLWKAVVRRQVACETLSEVLVYLHASLNGIILETLRVSKRTVAVSGLWPDVEHVCDSSKVWDRLQARFSGERERRLAYLLFHCGLEPAEIVRSTPQEWNDVQEVAGLRCVLLKRLVNEAHR